MHAAVLRQNPACPPTVVLLCTHPCRRLLPALVGRAAAAVPAARRALPTEERCGGETHAQRFRLAKPAHAAAHLRLLVLNAG